MKKFISIVTALALILAMAMAFTACAGTTPATSAAASSAAASEAPASSVAASEAPASSAPASEAPASSAPAVQEEFKVGMECAYAPYNWTQPDNSNNGVAIQGSGDFAGGYDVMIAQKIADGLGKKLVIVKTSWDGLLPALTSGVIDAIIAGMSPTPVRREAIDFTDSYYREDIVLGVVVKKGGKFENAKSFADFAGAKITGQLGTFHYDNMIDQMTGIQKQEAMKDFPSMRVALQSGIIDGYISEKPEGDAAMDANKKFFFVEFPAGQGFTKTEDFSSIAVGLKKGQEKLVSDINAILAKLTEDDRKQMMEKAGEIAKTLNLE